MCISLGMYACMLACMHVGVYVLQYVCLCMQVARWAGRQAGK